MTPRIILLATIAEGIVVVGVYAQLYRIKKILKTNGLALWTYALNVSANIAWVSFSFSKSIYIVAISNFLMGLMNLYILSKIIRNKQKLKQVLFVGFSCGVFLTFALTASGDFAGWVAVAFNLISSLPQIIKAMTNRNLDGLSVASQWYWFVAEIITISYGLMLGSWVLVVAGIRGLLTSIMLGALAYAKHRKLRYNSR